jgi:hypothetical protein
MGPGWEWVPNSENPNDPKHPGHWSDHDGNRWWFHPEDDIHNDHWDKKPPRGQKGNKERIPVDPNKPPLKPAPKAPWWARAGQYIPAPAPQNVRQWQRGFLIVGCTAALPVFWVTLPAGGGALAPLVPAL